MLPETSDKNAAEFMAEEREGDENEEQQPGRQVDPQGTWGMKFPSRWPCLRSTSHPCPSSGCLRGHAGPATGLESGGATGPGSQLLAARKALWKTHPGDAAPWQGMARQTPSHPLAKHMHAPYCPLPSPLPGTSRTSQTPPRNPDKLQHKLPRNTVLSARSPIPALSKRLLKLISSRSSANPPTPNG